MLPTGGMAVSLWPNMDSAFEDISEEIMTIVQKWKRRTEPLKISLRNEPRILDAGIPSFVTVEKSTIVAVLVRRTSSPGSETGGVRDRLRHSAG